MKLLKIEYKKRGQLLTRGIRLLIGDDLTEEEIREEALSQILFDLNVSKYSWEIIESEMEK